MPRSKEIQEQMRNKIVDMHQSGKCNKFISKALGFQWTTVRAIIHKWRKLGTEVYLPRSSRPTKITPRGQQQLIQEVIKEPRKTSRKTKLRFWSGQVKVWAWIQLRCCDMTLNSHFMLKPSNVAELKQFCTEEWAKIHPQRCERLIASYRKRIIAVVAGKGGSSY